MSSTKSFIVSKVIEENYYPSWLRDTLFISKVNPNFSNKFLEAQIFFNNSESFEIRITNKTDQIIQLGGTGLIANKQEVLLKYSPINNGKEKFYEILFCNFFEIAPQKLEVFHFKNSQIDLGNSVLGISFKNDKKGVFQKLNKNNWLILKVSN